MSSAGASQTSVSPAEPMMPRTLRGGPGGVASTQNGCAADHADWLPAASVARACQKKRPSASAGTTVQEPVLPLPTLAEEPLATTARQSMSLQIRKSTLP